MNNNDFLGKEPIGRLLFKLAVPAITAQLINMLYNIVDRIYIGHMEGVGSLALTGVGVCMPIIMLVTAFASLISMGGAPRASISMGKGDNPNAERILGSCLSLQLIISVLLTAVLLIWNRGLLMTFGASENTIGFAVDYMNIYAVGTLFVQLSLGMNAFISAQGFAKVSMLTVLIGAVLNIVLDPVFIFLFGMGVRGAALATIISQAVSAVWVIHFLTGKKTLLRLRRKNLRLDAKLLLPCLALGLAPFIMQASESVIAVCFNASLLRYGGDIAVGAMTILTSVMQFAMLPLQGLGQGAQPITSYNFGAGHADRVKAAFKLLLKSSVIYASVMWGLIMLFSPVFAMIFTPNPELIAYSGWALRIYAACLLLMGVQIACQMTFISIGNAKASITVAVLRKFILLIPLIYLLPNIFAEKTFAVYLAEPIADFLSVTFTAVLFSFQFKKALAKMREVSLPPEGN
jgi:putative MATE family efflux protein